MSVKVKSSGRGLDEILANLKSPSVSKVDVGIHGFEDADLLKYASAHEFGLGPQVQRSFIRQTFDKYADELKAIGVELSASVMDGKITLEQGLFAWGQELVTMINDEINAGSNFEANTPERIAQKGEGLHPLQDSGRLQQSIKAVVD
jgi:hypothetical protein